MVSVNITNLWVQHTHTQVHDATIRHRNRHVLVRALRASAKGRCGLASCREHPEWFLLFLKLFYLQFCIRYLDHGTHVLSHEYCTRTQLHSQEGDGWRKWWVVCYYRRSKLSSAYVSTVNQIMHCNLQLEKAPAVFHSRIPSHHTERWYQSESIFSYH